MSADAYAWWLRLTGSFGAGVILFGLGIGLAYLRWGRARKRLPGGPDRKSDPPGAEQP
jgi:hypothetical protein